MMTHPSQVKIEKETAVGLLLQNLIDQGYTIFLSDDKKNTSERMYFTPYMFQLMRGRLGTASCNFQCDDVSYPVTVKIKKTPNDAPSALLHFEGVYDEQSNVFKFVMAYDDSYQSVLKSSDSDIISAFEKHLNWSAANLDRDSLTQVGLFFSLTKRRQFYRYLF